MRPPLDSRKDFASSSSSRHAAAAQAASRPALLPLPVQTIITLLCVRSPWRRTCWPAARQGGSAAKKWRGSSTQQSAAAPSASPGCRLPNSASWTLWTRGCMPWRGPCLPAARQGRTPCRFLSLLSTWPATPQWPQFSSRRLALGAATRHPTCAAAHPAGRCITAAPSASTATGGKGDTGRSAAGSQRQPLVRIAADSSHVTTTACQPRRQQCWCPDSDGHECPFLPYLP